MNQSPLDEMTLSELVELKGRIENIIQVRTKPEREEALARELCALRVYEEMIAELHNKLLAPILR